MSEDHSADRARLLALLPLDGSAVGNTALIRQLTWSETRYWYARDSLLEAGTIVRAKGRGGAVRRLLPDQSVTSAASAEAELAGEAALAYVHEADLYPQTRDTLETFWAKERQIEPLAVEITASQGRRATGGRWTRPDLVSVAVRTYRYLPGNSFISRATVHRATPMPSRRSCRHTFRAPYTRRPFSRSSHTRMISFFSHSSRRSRRDGSRSRFFAA